MSSYKKTKSITTLLQKKDQLTSLKKCVLAIYLSSSENNLFTLMQKKLPLLCNVDFIKLSHQYPVKKTKYIYSYPFIYNDEQYCINFHKTLGFVTTHKSFLKTIGKTLESTLIYMEKHKNLIISKKQWELAFDTITTPICLTSLSGNIIRTNTTFRKYTKLSKVELLQKNYFSAFFKKPENKKSLLLNKNQETLVINGKPQIFELSIQKISQNTNKKILLVILRNITEQIKIEKQIAESAQSAELGIISSSIAHELNNPMAGIYGLLQTMTLSQKNKILDKDIKQMSSSIQQCIYIIDKLLNIHY